MAIYCGKNYNNFTILILSFIAVFVFFENSPNAFADDQVLITKTATLNHVIFDGKWTFYTEWKESSLNDLAYNDTTRIELRSAHQDNYLYFMIDALTQTNFVKNADKAIICLEANDSKPQIPDSNDYCFISVLNGKNSFVLQGGSPLELTNHYKIIPSPNDFIAIGGISDQNDRYTPIPHTSYEFRIPIDLVGRSDIYGIYIGVYDSHSNIVYSYPQDIGQISSLKIPSPSQWGTMISPDKSLPEFPLPALILPTALSITLYFTKSRFRTMS
ncbi:MAG: hypothetical protein WA799_00510 [Nitrosotalea sp.]